MTDAVRQLPTFCWQTFEEVLWYVEQICEEADYYYLGAILRRLVITGEIEVKDAPKTNRKKGRRVIHMYKRRAP